MSTITMPVQEAILPLPNRPTESESIDRIKTNCDIRSQFQGVQNGKPHGDRGSSKTRQPSYRLHKATGQAVVTLNGREIYLGKHGTKASKAAYDRKLAEWLAGGRRLPGGTTVTVAGVIKVYWPFAEKHYRRLDGTPTNEINEVKASIRPLNHLYGTLPAASFGPLALKAIRQLMIDGYEHPKYGHQVPLSRGVINHRLARIKRMFRWAVENELVSGSVYHALTAVRGLQRGRSEAREAPGVHPVARAVVEDTLPLFWPTMRDMVRLQLETGMRPGELVTMRGCDIDMTGKTWLYSPPQHKNLHHGHGRAIAIGPRAQEIIQRHLTMNTGAILFSPRAVMEEKAVALRAKRKTKVQPSQQNRRKKNPKKRPANNTPP